MAFCIVGTRFDETTTWATRSNEICVVNVDYFTNWAKAEPLATITKKKTKTFVERNIIYQFKIPSILIIDNEKQFDNANFKKFYANLSIDLKFVSPAYPKVNGLVEVVNKMLKKVLKKRLDDKKRG